MPGIPKQGMGGRNSLDSDACNIDTNEPSVAQGKTPRWNGRPYLSEPDPEDSMKGIPVHIHKSEHMMQTLGNREMKQFLSLSKDSSPATRHASRKSGVEL